ncbi:hypothetical protein CIPAW_15G146200 [Carya illinoinensis]|uniref:Uncharacterized protein n=1 Tax=Carya illinoinensis TaxID=32201 RepID=A0A8T1N7H5_CARIL|nr:hypothetical protein CIPAW_15G146200 [Carya illinoinensis]
MILTKSQIGLYIQPIQIDRDHSQIQKAIFQDCNTYDTEAIHHENLSIQLAGSRPTKTSLKLHSLSYHYPFPCTSSATLSLSLYIYSIILYVESTT